MARLYRYEGREDLPFRLAAQHATVGRLGKIFSAFDELSGRVITVESIPLKPLSNRNTGDSDSDPFALIEATLLPELEAQDTAIQSHPHIVCYDALHCVTQDHHVFLSANSSPARLVSSLLKDFGKLHPLVVRNYVRGIVSALCTLHKNGVVVGGISSSSILISSDGRAQLTSCFPSARAIQALLDSEVLAHDQISRCVLNRQSLENGCTQDARSIAYVMAEMLTGMRMRGHLLEREHLLSHVASNSLENQFLHELLIIASSSSSLTALLEHPYICEHSNKADPSGHHRQLQLHNPVDNDKQPNISANEQRVIALLVDQELLKCREQRRRLLGEIRTWLAQFERRYERKPTASERPKSVTLLQRRCRLLSDRMKELETRLSSARKSFYREKSNDDDESSSVRRDEVDELENARLEASPRSFASSSVDSKLGILPAIDVSIRDGDLMRDISKRSPAQNAFLKRLGPQQQAQQDNEDDGDSSQEQQQRNSIVSDRANGHQIIHQRKEVMQVIDTIAASALTTSISRSSSPY